jgi:hypothetical protein
MYVTIPLGNGYETTVSFDDFHLVSGRKWFATEVHPGKRYAMRAEQSGGRQHTVYLHRVITGAEKGQLVDHANGDGLDNRRENLRLCDASLNCVNRRNYKPASGFRGVYPSGKRWVALLWSRGKRYRGGSFVTKEEAARAYDAMAHEHFGEFAVLNFPELVSA